MKHDKNQNLNERNYQASDDNIFMNNHQINQTGISSISSNAINSTGVTGARKANNTSNVTNNVINTSNNSIINKNKVVKEINNPGVGKKTSGLGSTMGSNMTATAKKNSMK